MLAKYCRVKTSFKRREEVQGTEAVLEEVAPHAMEDDSFKYY
jgi:hypothetical protein